MEFALGHLSEFVNSTDSKGNTPLHIASKLQRPLIVETLLVHGADCTLPNLEGKSAYDIGKKNTQKLISST